MHQSKRGAIDYELMFAATPRPNLPEVLLSFSSTVKVRRRHVFERHRHLDHEVIFVESGRYEGRLNAEPLRLGPRAVLLVKPGDWHEDRLEPKARYRTVSFSLVGGGSRAIVRQNATLAQQLLVDETGELGALAKAISQEFSRNDFASGPLEQALTTELVWRLIRALPREALCPDLVQALDAMPLTLRLRQLFEAHAGRALSVTQMAHALGLSTRGLSARCQVQLGVSPAKAFTAYRLTRGRELLCQTSLSIKEIAASLGYENAFQFSRAYKLHFGRPPSLARSP